MVQIDPLIALLASAGVARSSAIHVTGPSGLSALLWLCRHGFEKVAYVRSGVAHPHQDADAVVVAHTCTPAWLQALLRHGPRVREGGVLVFRSPLPVGGPGDPIHALLAVHGYDVERCIHGAHRELHVARRRTVLARAA
jgi:hypothetical protein